LCFAFGKYLVLSLHKEKLNFGENKEMFHFISFIMSRDQNAGRSHSMKIDNRSIERVEEFKYLGTTLTNNNSIQEEIKSRLQLRNACYYSVQNLLSSS